MTEKNHSVVPHADAAPTREIMHPLVQQMVKQNQTPEALAKMYDLQRQWEKDEAKRAFDSALVELKRALPKFLERDKTVEFEGKSGRSTKYTHTTLAAAMETVTEILVDHGFSLTWETECPSPQAVKVTATLAHRLGHSKSTSLIAPPDTSGLKNPAQGVASTVTILERYTALALLGLATKDMNEPTGEGTTAPSDKIDTSRNMRAMSDLAKMGKNKAEVEKFVGKPVTQWNTGDLDKLRAWIDPPAQPAGQGQAPQGELITKEEAANLRSIMSDHKLTNAQFRTIVAEEIGRTPDGAGDLRKPEYEKVVKLFADVDSGAVQLRDGKIHKFPASSPEDDDIPFGKD